jgi:hypothetical protein
VKAEVIPLLIVDDVRVNVEYLEYTLGFRLDNTVAEEELAVMKYRCATVMLQSRKAYAASRGASFEKFVPADGIELMLQTDNLDEAYAAAVKNNAQVTRHLPTTREASGPVFAVSAWCCLKATS